RRQHSLHQNPKNWPGGLGQSPTRGHPASYPPVIASYPGMCIPAPATRRVSEGYMIPRIHVGKQRGKQRAQGTLLLIQQHTTLSAASLATSIILATVAPRSSARPATKFRRAPRTSPPDLGRGDKSATTCQRHLAKMHSALVRAVHTFFQNSLRLCACTK